MRWLLFPLALVCALQASCAQDEPELGTSSQYSIIETTTTSLHVVGTIVQDDQHFFAIQVPDDSTDIRIDLSGNGDADLYTNWVAPPSTARYACRPYQNGSDELCFHITENGELFVMVRGWAGRSDYELLITWIVEGIGTSPGPNPL